MVLINRSNITTNEFPIHFYDKEEFSEVLFVPIAIENPVGKITEKLIAKRYSYVLVKER